MEDNYIIKSERLGFRNWRPSDIDEMFAINSDKDVMEFFPAFPTKEQTAEFIERMNNQFLDSKFCYFAVDKLENQEFIGFIGLSKQTYDAKFTPCIDIGWRIKSSEWNKGFATGGAKRCLDYAFNDLEIGKVYSVAPKINIKILTLKILNNILAIFFSLLAFLIAKLDGTNESKDFKNFF